MSLVKSFVEFSDLALFCKTLYSPRSNVFEGADEMANSVDFDQTVP